MISYYLYYCNGSPNHNNFLVEQFQKPAQSPFYSIHMADSDFEKCKSDHVSPLLNTF